MLSRCALTLAARCRSSAHGANNSTAATITRSVVASISNSNLYHAYQPKKHHRMMTTVRDAATADDALRFSGYSEIDFTVPEDAPVYDAVQKFAAFNIGCLVTVDTAGNMTGVVSERDYVCKVALLGRTSQNTTVKEISTRGANIITATADESVENCMEKMMNHGVRHLPIVDSNKAVIGMVSIKDLVKTVLKEKEKTIKVLSDFALGKGGHYGSD